MFAIAVSQLFCIPHFRNQLGARNIAEVRMPTIVNYK
jgi:hypothetical protein